MPKNWQVAPVAPTEIKAKFPELSPVVLQLLYNRGLDSQEKVDEFLNPDYEQDLHDPFLFKDMKKAVKRIMAAVKKGEKILVHGDYDADGVSSSAVMTSVLQKLIEKFRPEEAIHELPLQIYIPHREKEGYGLNVEAVKGFIKDKINLIITVDCGIANAAEINLCNQAGIDVIVTDHHSQPLELPQSFALIDPKVEKEKYPFRELAGAGVAFKVAQALIKEAKKLDDQENWEGLEKWLLDLVAIGTVADCSPLLGENRTLVKYGLVVLNKTPRLGLQALFLKAAIGGNNRINGGLKDYLPTKAGWLNTYSIAFQISPRLNAAGRLGHANTAYRLLITTDRSEAEDMADLLNQTNSQRQVLTDRLTEEVRQKVETSLKTEKLLFALGKDWPLGVIGLVAGKIMDQYNRPVIVASENDGEIVGSGRSLPAFNVIEALQQLDYLFANYGGHPAACGFTLKDKNDLAKFKKEIQQSANKNLVDKDLTKALLVEAVVDLEEVTWSLYDSLNNMEPFGDSNPRPKFLVQSVEVEALEPVGKDNLHLRLLVKQKNGLLRKFIGFGIMPEHNNKIKKGDRVDIVFDVGVNEWNGNRELQLKVIDLEKKDE
ncbi:MAG: single-stranded-DNA-specific exonuclease RecJ [Patescibacteria group bacterium]